MARNPFSLEKVTLAERPLERDERFLRSLQKIVGKRYVLSAPEELLVYESDACLLMRSMPDMVVLPRTTEEVSRIVRLCRDSRVPYVARGAGTGLSGGALPLEGGLIIGLNRMNKIQDVDLTHRTATVEVGVVNAQLNRVLSPHGLFYAPDPSSQSACTIGGNVAENAGGIHCVKYGVTTDHILSVEVVLPDGEIVWLGGKNRRQHGLNLTGLMVGSEGTLGVITRAVLRLLPKPERVRVYLMAFDKVADATQTVSDIISSGLIPSALEYMDAFTVRAVNAAFQVGFPETSEAVLLAELDGTAEQVENDAKRLSGIIEAHQPSMVRWAEEESERQRLWAARKGAVAAYGRILPAFYLHDCVIPRSKLTEVLEAINATAEKWQVVVGNVFHAGDGNLHPNLLFDPADAEMVQRTLQCGEEILEICLNAGGTLSGEHGIGIEKAQYMGRLFSEQDLAKMLQVKHMFDPERLANPLKIFPQRRGCGEVHQSHRWEPGQMNLEAGNNAANEGQLWI